MMCIVEVDPPYSFKVSVKLSLIYLKLSSRILSMQVLTSVLRIFLQSLTFLSSSLYFKEPSLIYSRNYSLIFATNLVSLTSSSLSYFSKTLYFLSISNYNSLVLCATNASTIFIMLISKNSTFFDINEFSCFWKIISFSRIEHFCSRLCIYDQYFVLISSKRFKFRVCQ